MAYLTNTSVNGDLGVSGLVSVGSAGLKFTSDIINIFGTENSGGTGNHSISIGDSAAATNNYGVAVGYGASASGTSGIAIGGFSLTDTYKTTASGSYSIAIGPYCTQATGDYSIAVGYMAKAGGDTNKSYGIAIGYGAAALTQNKGIAIGYGSKTSAGTVINYNGTYSNGIRLGYYNTNGTNLYISWNGSSNGTISTSDRRDKFNIEEINIDKALEFITKVKPVTYNYNYREEYLIDPDKNKLEYDEVEHQKGSKKNNRRSSGVIAQDVYSLEKEVFNDDNFAAIVDYNKYYSKDDAPDELDRYYVRYEQFIPFLIASIKKLNIEIESLKNEIKKLKNTRE